MPTSDSCPSNFLSLVLVLPSSHGPSGRGWEYIPHSPPPVEGTPLVVESVRLKGKTRLGWIFKSPLSIGLNLWSLRLVVADGADGNDSRGDDEWRCLLHQGQWWKRENCLFFFHRVPLLPSPSFCSQRPRHLDSKTPPIHFNIKCIKCITFVRDDSILWILGTLKYFHKIKTQKSAPNIPALSYIICYWYDFYFLNSPNVPSNMRFSELGAKRVVRIIELTNSLGQCFGQELSFANTHVEGTCQSQSITLSYIEWSWGKSCNIITYEHYNSTI